jgi:hypothetical protein
MSDKNRVAGEIKKFGKMLQGFLDFTKELEEMGAFEVALADAKKQQELAYEGSLKAKEELKHLQEDVEFSKKLLKNTVDGSAETLLRAKEAEESAKKALKSEGEAIKKLELANASLASLEAVILERNSSLMGLEALILDKEKKLAQVTAALEKLKGSI